MKIWRKKKYSVICLQDIHISEKDKNMFENEWGLKCIIAPFTSNARGVAILFNNNTEIEIHKSYLDEGGNYIISDVTIDGIKMTLSNIYGPNKDEPTF